MDPGGLSFNALAAFWGLGSCSLEFSAPWQVLKKGDIIRKVQGQDIGDDGKVPFRGARNERTSQTAMVAMILLAYGASSACRKASAIGHKPFKTRNMPTGPQLEDRLPLPHLEAVHRRLVQLPGPQGQARVPRPKSSQGLRRAPKSSEGLFGSLPGNRSQKGTPGKPRSDPKGKDEGQLRASSVGCLGLKWS